MAGKLAARVKGLSEAAFREAFSSVALPDRGRRTDRDDPVAPALPAGHRDPPPARDADGVMPGQPGHPEV